MEANEATHTGQCLKPSHKQYMSSEGLKNTPWPPKFCVFKGGFTNHSAVDLENKIAFLHKCGCILQYMATLYCR